MRSRSKDETYKSSCSYINKPTLNPWHPSFCKLLRANPENQKVCPSAPKNRPDRGKILESKSKHPRAKQS
jgi:hypothetical protein